MKLKTMRTTIQATSPNRVTLTHTRWSGERVTMYLVAPAGGGYVRFDHGGQVCDQLASTGPTLHWPGTYPLIDLIRHEYRAMRRAEKRFLEA